MLTSRILQRNLTSSTKLLSQKLYEDDILLKVKPKIGLEVHALLKTRAKLFSKGCTNYKAFPNTQLDFHDVAIPGSLPQLNLAALEAAIISSLALNCKIQNEIHFDRKNYFYPDMPSGFQITQHHKPLALDGYLEFIVTPHYKTTSLNTFGINKYLSNESTERECKIVRSKIKQVQLEQDSAKMFHEELDEKLRYSLIDYNRSGCGLIEIVFEPDLSNSLEATALIRELIMLLKMVDTCGCELQEGSLRVDANVSVAYIEGINLFENNGKVELKNLNSLKSIKKGLDCEIDRQVKLLYDGQIVEQETRTFNTKKGITTPLRLKEDSVDYRFVPEPSIPPLVIEDDFVRNLRHRLPPELPCSLRQELIDMYKLDKKLVTPLIERKELKDLFTSIIDKRQHYNPNVVADFLLDCSRKLEDIPMKKDGNSLNNIDLNILIDIFDLFFDEKVSSSITYELIKFFYINKSEKNPIEIVEEFDWLQINDREKIDNICREFLKNMRNIPKKFKKTGDIKYLKSMLQKLNELQNDKINLDVASMSIKSILRPRDKN